MSDKDYHEMIEELRDERVDVDAVYIGDFKPEKDTIEEVIDEVIVLKDPYIPQRFRDEDKEEIAQEIFEIADSTLVGHLMDTAECQGGIPIMSIKKDLSVNDDILMIEWEATSDIMEHVDLMVLSGLMHRNWGAFDQMTTTEIIAGITVFYPDNDPAVIEAAIYSLLFVVQAERAA
ncbi:MAG: hypothetical protein GQ553_04395 [Nitrosomonadaceae bacterium]|nr:hypothetical protein [Nitrosomonadaceae bacterium]